MPSMLITEVLLCQPVTTSTAYTLCQQKSEFRHWGIDVKNEKMRENSILANIARSLTLRVLG